MIPKAATPERISNISSRQNTPDARARRFLKTGKHVLALADGDDKVLDLVYFEVPGED